MGIIGIAIGLDHAVDFSQMPVSQSAKNEAYRITSEFRDRCHRLAFGFDVMGAERQHGRQRLEASFVSNPEFRGVSINIARQTNDDPNNIELETIASMLQGDLAVALQQNGEFDNLNRQSYLVFIYHLWDEHYRNEIAKVLGLGSKNKVYCDLLGDIRQIRNCIIHDQAVLFPTRLKELTVLLRIWDLQPGELSITWEMMTDLLAEFRTLTVRWD